MNSGAAFLSRLPLFAGVSGRVAVRRKDPESGIEFLLAELAEGEMLGEMALLTRKARTASVVALESTTCGIIEQSDFDQLLTEHQAAVRAMMAVLADRELQLAADSEEQKAETKQDLMSASEDAPVIKLANSILGLAIRQGASDIHIEPMEADVTVRFRIDGVLQVLQKLPKRVQLGLISRFKILSRLDIAEKRLRDMIEQPYGIIYVTGPTGSGKTTTLYSSLAEINDPGVNVSVDI